jgi:hypothetical protein
MILALFFSYIFMKKFLVFLSLIAFMFIWLWIQYSFAEERSKAAIVKDIILKKRELEKNSSKWELYVQALDAYFEKYADDTDKIDSLISKLSLTKSKLWNSEKEQEIRLLIEYIEYKAQLTTYLSVKNGDIIIKWDSYSHILQLSENEIIDFLAYNSNIELENTVQYLYKDTETINKTIIDWYLPQAWKARDVTRISDLKAIQSGINQIYQDLGKYPSKEAFYKEIVYYLPNIPKDMIAWRSIDGCNYWYIYSIWDDPNFTKDQHYKLSTCLETKNPLNAELINKYEVWNWSEKTIFTDQFYINDISEWHPYIDNYTKSNVLLENFTEAEKTQILRLLIIKSYIEANPSSEKMFY